eukprot:g23408.t1
MIRRPLLSLVLLLAPFATDWQSFTGGWRDAGRGARHLCQRRAVAEPDPCDVLGLPAGTRDEEQIRGAFRRWAKVYHPDVPDTGDIGKFQELQRAAQKLITGHAGRWKSGGLVLFQLPFRMEVMHKPPSVTHQPLEQSDFAGTRNGRVDVGYCSSVRAPNLRKTARLTRSDWEWCTLLNITGITHPATPETLARVQQVFASFGAETLSPQTLLPLAGFVLEGHTHSIGEQRVADLAMALEKEHEPIPPRSEV